MEARPLFGQMPFIGGGRSIKIHATSHMGQTTSTAVPPGTKCYDCGIQGVRAMTPTMAAMNSACREVANSVCEAAAGTGTVQTTTSGTSQQTASGSTSTPPATTTPTSPCPAVSDALVCAVYEAQALYRRVYDGQIAAWGSSPQGQSFAADQAHAAVADFSNPTLRAHWDTYSWWIGDMGIKPEEWPELTRNYEQFLKVWNAVPWPKGGALKDLFVRCARGQKLQNGYSAADARLYVNRFSGFWPKTDEQIRRVIALMGLQNMMAIYGCMEHKVQKKIQNEARKAKKWQIIGTAAGMVFTGNIVASVIFSAASEMAQFKDAMDFSKFMMGYSEFVQECYAAEAEDFTCTYLGPFVLWSMETLFMNEFYDWVAQEVGLPGARPGLTQEEVVKPMVAEMKAAGIDVPRAVYTPGGVAPGPSPLLVAGGIGAAGLVVAALFGAFGK
jgi:hypothetical protein